MCTLAVHAGEPRPSLGDAITMPIFQSSTYELGEPENFDDIRYIRLNNTPNHRALGEKLAALEGAGAALVTPSGTAAISLTLTTLLNPGDHLVAPDVVYGGSRKIFEALRERSVEVTYAPFDQPRRWAEAIRPTTRAIYCESLLNPSLDVPPLDELAMIARERDVVSIVDNTLLSPVYFRPVEMGFDLVLHSASKYLNGHSDVVAGVVAGRSNLVERVRKVANLHGVCLDPGACFLLHRGLKTLPLRVEAQGRGAMELASWLAQQPEIEIVRYPGLPDDPSHARAERWFDGFGSMITMRPRGGLEVTKRLLSKLRYPREAPSLGGVESLVCRPATTSHAGLPASVRHDMGVHDADLRISVGIEGARDLIADFAQALSAAP